MTDTAMGTTRTYIKPKLRTREENYLTRTIISTNPLSARRAPPKVRQVTTSDISDGDRSDEARRNKMRADKRRAERVLQDGRLVATNLLEHGTLQGYRNWYCRCVPCSTAYSEVRATRN